MSRIASVSQNEAIEMAASISVADDSRNQKGGYGIGLSAAQAIVLSHGGTISAHYEDGNTICFNSKI